MKKVRKSSVEGKFYHSDKAELELEIVDFIKNNKTEYNNSSRAIIVPHAGYFYSGQLASECFQYLDKKAKTVFVIAPVHYVPIDGLAVSSFDEWETPLGNISLDKEINEELIASFGANFNDEAFKEEHSVEVQVPFIQKLFPDAKIVPILTGNTDYKQISRIISHFWQNSENVFVISSDLSHFYHNSDAQKIDQITADMIEMQEINEFNPHQACGYVGILGLVDFAKENKFSFIRVNLQNSSVINQDKSKVVGYGGWFVYEGTREKFIKDNFSLLLKNICEESILYGLKNRRCRSLDLNDFPQVLRQQGASFVTLEIDDYLRGCIGSIIAQKPLVEDLNQNAFSSAFSDSRFPPLMKEEYDKLKIAISLLSSPIQLFFKDEAELLSQIQENIDGIIIRDGYHQAVYLPSVWEQLPDKKVFLSSLKQKAGLSPSHFSETFEAYYFRVEYIKD